MPSEISITSDILQVLTDAILKCDTDEEIISYIIANLAILNEVKEDGREDNSLEI